VTTFQSAIGGKRTQDRKFFHKTCEGVGSSRARQRFLTCHPVDPNGFPTAHAIAAGAIAEAY
jgi:hypothetical protein